MPGSTLVPPMTLIPKAGREYSKAQYGVFTLPFPRVATFHAFVPGPQSASSQIDDCYNKGLLRS